MANRSIRAGETIKLRAKFQDDLGQNAQADNVWVRIFPAGADVNDPSLAIVSSGNATYFGAGIFEYSYLTPSNGPDGTWHDQWNGDLTSQKLFANLSFDVGASGVISTFDNQLTLNNIVEITLHSGIRSTEGGWLQEDYQFSFMTETFPTYANTRKLRLDYGGFLAELNEDTLQVALLEASLEADQLTFSNQQNSKVFKHARREWVTCKAATLLLGNLGHNMLKSKSLGDLSVSYDTQGLRDALGNAIDCLNRWELQLMTGGYAKAAQEPRGVVKGACDPDRPAIGRLWEGTFINPLPAVNSKIKYNTQRRWKGTFFNSRRRFW